jgi:hypothetical protein
MALHGVALSLVDLDSGDSRGLDVPFPERLDPEGVFSLRNAAQVAPASGIPMIYPYLALPVGAFLMLIQIALSWIAGFEPDASDQDEAEGAV